MPRIQRTIMPEEKILLPHQLYFSYMDVHNRASDETKREFYVALNDSADAKKTIIYIHVPFCNSKCIFCGFYKINNPTLFNSYTNILKKEVDFYASKTYIRGLRVKGVHWGGGTPTCLPIDLMGECIDYVRDTMNTGNAPLNIEASPITLNKDKIRILKRKNVSRISIGVQTFNEELRDKLEIRSDIEDVYSAIKEIKEQGIIAYIDLMHCFPNYHGVDRQTDIVKNDIETAVKLGVDGIDFSQYYPSHDKLAQEVKTKKLTYPSMEEAIDILQNSTELLKKVGFNQVTEYSFCMEGVNVILDTAYYRENGGNIDCIGLGPSAIGFLNGHAYKMAEGNEYFNEAVPAYLLIKKLTKYEIQRLPIIGFPKLLKLPRNYLSGELEVEYNEIFIQLASEGLINKTQTHYEITPLGKLFIDNIRFRLMGQEDRKRIESKVHRLT